MITNKIVYNKKNNQLYVTLSRKKLNISKKKVPKFINFENIKVGY